MKKRKSTRKVVRLAPRRREADDLVRFIDAHGGKVAPFRAYQVRVPDRDLDAPRS